MTVPTAGLTVEVAFGGVPFDPETWTWTDVSAWVISGSMHRGRGTVLDLFEPGTLAVTLKNTDRRFDPLNLDGPYVDTGVTQILPNTPIRIVGLYNTLFTGYLDDPIDTQMGFPEDATVTFTASDVLKLLAGIELPLREEPRATIIEEAGTAYNNVLDDIGWAPNSAGGVYDAQKVSKGNEKWALVNPTYYGTNALAELQGYAAADGGFLYATRDGAVCLESRLHDPGDPATTTTFTDGPNDVDTGPPVVVDVGFADIQIAHNRVLRNRVLFTRDSGLVFEAIDQTSIDAYADRTLDLSGAPIFHDAEIESRCAYNLRALKDPYSHVSSVTVNITESGLNAEYGTGTTMDLRDRVNADFTPPGGGDPIQQELVIEEIDYEWDGTDWTFRFGFSSWDRVSFNDPDDWLILDDDPDGKLGSGRVLAY